MASSLSPVCLMRVIEERVQLIDLLALRGSILGTIADYERAQELAHQLVRDAPSDASRIPDARPDPRSLPSSSPMPWMILTLPSGSPSMPRSWISSVPRSFRGLVDMRKPSRSARRLPAAPQALRALAPYRRYAPKAAISNERCICTARACAGIGGSHRSRLRSSISRSVSCGCTTESSIVRETI